MADKPNPAPLPSGVTQRMNQGINMHKALAMQGLPDPVRSKK